MIIKSFQVSLIILLFMCTQGMADANKIQGDQNIKTTSEALYDKCKAALENNFHGSFCAAYIEGYIWGGTVSSLYIIGLSSNQNEIFENAKTNKCKELEQGYKTDIDLVERLAQHFVNWIDGNQDVIDSENSFLNREAAIVLHGITTDERFCELTEFDENKQ